MITSQIWNFKPNLISILDVHIEWEYSATEKKASVSDSFNTSNQFYIFYQIWTQSFHISFRMTQYRKKWIFIEDGKFGFQIGDENFCRVQKS